MTQLMTKRFAKSFSFSMLAAGILLAGLPGCNGIELPIEVTIPVSQGSNIVAANETDGDVDVVVGAFCDLVNKEDLDALIRQFGGDLIADLVEITRVELDGVTITATSGNFDTFTSSDISLVFLAADPLQLGIADDAQGLGSAFELTQDEPVDLLNDLEDGECGAPTLHLEGEAPAADITFSTDARLKVYTRIALP